MSTQQFDLWGGYNIVDDIEERVERILEEHPEARGSDKTLILYLWLEEDGLDEILGDDGLRDRFRQWFLTQATYTETITRARRALQADGRSLPERPHQARREARQEQWRNWSRRS